MKYGSDDLAKYTFLPEAGDYIRANEISITDLISPVFKDVVKRAEDRVLESVRVAKVSDKRVENRDVEIMSFPVALMLVRATNLNHLMDRYALAEAMRAEGLMKREDNQKIIEDIFQTFLNVQLEHSGTIGYPKFRVSIPDYLKRAVAFHKPEWKLVNRIVDRGKVYVSQEDLIRLIREEIRDLILQRLRATKVAKLPKDLDDVVKKIIELSPPPKTNFTKLNIAPENYPPCTKPDEIILGDNVKIREMQIGSHAIGRYGLNNVTDTFVRNYKGPMIRIKAQGLLPIELTPEHPLLVCRSISKSNGGIVGFTPPDWKPARDVMIKPLVKDGDFVVTPKIERRMDVAILDLSGFGTEQDMDVSPPRGKRSQLLLTSETAWLMGVYVATGRSTPCRGEVVFALDQDRLDLQEGVPTIGRKLGYSSRVRKEKKVRKYYLPSPQLSRAFRLWFGKGARNMKIPDFIMLHRDDDILRAFIKGWEDGNGYWYHNGEKTSKLHFVGATVSRTLGLQLQLLYMSLGIGANLIRVARDEAGKIIGKNVSVSDLYLIDYSLTGSRLRHRRHEELFLHPIRTVDTIHYDGPVHNIETADNTYLVCNAIVHNCVKEALRLLEKGENVPHYGRFLMATYLLAAGKSVDDIMEIFPKSPDFKKSVTKYQVEHIAGMKGGKTRYSVPSCKTLQTRSFCFKDPVKCFDISSPLQFPSKKTPMIDEKGKIKKQAEEKRKGWTKNR